MLNLVNLLKVRLKNREITDGRGLKPEDRRPEILIVSHSVQKEV